MGRRLRVVQWATGNIGTHSLREVIRHPELELVGVLVFDPAKEGVDAGELCGLAPVGVAATTDKAAITSLGADCVLYMPADTVLDDVVELLASGANVITTRGDLAVADRRHGDEGWGRIREACTAGGSSLYATGSSPGFISDALPFALLSLQRHVDSIEIEEFANMSQRNSPEMLFNLMGFGRPPSGMDELRAQYLLGEFGPHLGVLAEAAGRPVDEWQAEGSVSLASEAVQIAAGEIPKGTVAAQRTTITGLSGGTVAVRFTANWFCTREIEEAWDFLDAGWRVRVAGDAPLKIEIEFPVPLEDFGPVMPGYTGNRPVNAIPYVCAAPPGPLTTAQLPHVVPAGPTAEA
jgi:4-hydroxy-tetrahydrodipicolinate reductase